MADNDEITQEELFEQHRAEIEELFDEKGFFRRMLDMFRGLKASKSSREYKLARIELQRLVAPLVAILLPVLGVIVLIVVTAVSGQVDEHVTVDIAQIQDDDAPLEDTPDPPEEEIDMTQDIDVTVDVSTDVPTPDMAEPAPPSPDPGGEPDKVAAAPSPVTMSAVSGTVKMRGLGEGKGSEFGQIIGNGGKGQNTKGCLIGTIIDFKSNSDGSPRSGYSVDQNNGELYWKDVRYLLDNDFSQKALSKYFVPPKRVALNHLFISFQSADNGPKSFGVAQYMKPKGFMAYYSGELKPTETARYRFDGNFDDFILVRIDRKVVLEKAAGPVRNPITGWNSSDNGMGDWFAVKSGKPVFIEIMVGERPGGIIGGYLAIQKEGQKYDLNPQGRPILPIFASRPLSLKEREKLDGQYQCKTLPPKFNSRGSITSVDTDDKADKDDEGVKARKEMTKDDVSVTVDI